MNLLHIKNNIIINSINVLADAFISNKKNALVLVFNNYNHILQNTSVDLNKITISIDNKNLEYTFIRDFNDFNTIEGVNPKHFFNNKFHNEILIVENFTIDHVASIDGYVIGVSLYNKDNVLFSVNELQLEAVCGDFLNKKCVSTIHKNEYDLIPLWVEYHKKLGFEKFIIYDNNYNETMNHTAMSKIEKYKDDVYIINANWEYWVNSYGNSSVGQCIQQNHCIWKYSPRFLLLSDLDEFVNIKSEYLFNENISILSIPNYWFGCNNKTKFDYTNFIYKLTKRTAHQNPSGNRKCLIQSNYVDLFCVHIPVVFTRLPLDESKSNQSIKDVVYLNYEDGYLNHYHILSDKKRPCYCYIHCQVKDYSILYKMCNDVNTFDVVIPIGPNDLSVIHKQIEYTKKNIIGCRNIYLICSDSSLQFEGCVTISENIFPFSLETVANHHGKINRNGWYLQQLLKLYAGVTIPDILERYLVLDADTFFLKPTVFYKDGKCLYNYGTENHLPYFEHMRQLGDKFSKQIQDKSGICHHMMFETKYVKEIFDIVENKYNDSFYNVFLKMVAPQNYHHSGASEFEIYFNYMVKMHPDEIIIRELIFENVNGLRLDSDNDYISYHHYMR